ncbi:hypothetical protein TNCV_2880121 [Trichonephila clavipes]|uniref:Uncharacterized protein n=1 Tax=Trichonephila clavipes TaxID=2585209 RepID=A0A8X6W2A4_TRICX|nr:hypothetical protein TNCV_2880121 [Trichonephila clavipes]
MVMVTETQCGPWIMAEEECGDICKCTSVECGFWDPILQKRKAGSRSPEKGEKIFLGKEREASPAVPDAIARINHPALFPETSGNGPPSNKNNDPHVSIATITERHSGQLEKWCKSATVSVFECNLGRSFSSILREVVPLEKFRNLESIVV